MVATRANRAASGRAPRIPRAQRAREVQDAIDAAALEILPRHGVDGLALTKVAEAAGLSNGPLYGRYDSSEDIALDLWERMVREHFVDLVRRTAEWLVRREVPTPDELAAPTTLTLAAAEIIAVARRNPLLAESVREDLDRTWSEVRDSYGDVHPSLMVLALVIPVGATLLHGLLPDGGTDWSRAGQSFRDQLSERALLAGPRRASAPAVLPFPTVRSDDAVLDSFVVAVAQVVSRVGYERTTAHRIARAAGHSFSTAYNHAGSKDELMNRAIVATIHQMLTKGDMSYAQLTGEDYVEAAASLVMGLCDDCNRNVRGLRIETYLAARHHDELGVVVRDSLQSLLSKVESRFVSGVGSPEEARNTWQLNRCTGAGLIAVSLATPALSKLDWHPHARLAKYVFDTTLLPLLPSAELDRG